MKSNKTIAIMALVIAGMLFVSCKKEERSLHNKMIHIEKQQKNLLDEGSYPFVLSEENLPFQYAVYGDDELIFFEGIHSIISETTLGYCIATILEDGMCGYGYVDITSAYYDSTLISIDIIDIDSMDEELIYGINHIRTNNKNRFDRWVKRKMGRRTEINMWKEGDYYCACVMRY